MNAAKRAASQTITVAAIQVHGAFDRETVGQQVRGDERDERGEHRGSHESQPLRRRICEQERVEQCEDDREDCDRHEEGRAVQVHAVEERCVTDQADRVCGGRHRDAHEQADHAGTPRNGPDG